MPSLIAAERYAGAKLAGAGTGISYRLSCTERIIKKIFQETISGVAHE